MEVDETYIMGSKPGNLGRGADGNWLFEKQKWEDGKMKKKVMLVALLCVLGMTTLSIGNANAAQGFYTCTVNATGAMWWGFQTVTLTDNGAAFGPQEYFILEDGTGMSKSMYAAALTAFANSTSVKAYLDTTASTVYLLYATK